MGIALIGGTLVLNHNVLINGTLTVKNPPKNDYGNPFIVEDKNGAGMLGTNVFNTWSAEPICVENERLFPVECFGGKFGDVIVSPEIVFYDGNGNDSTHIVKVIK